MNTNKKVVLVAVCAGLAAMAVVWVYRGKSARAKAPVAAKAPAAATAPAAGSHVSAFSDHPFTADMTITGKLATYHGRMYAGHDALRTDVGMGHGKTASMIVRYDKGIAWILTPGKQYMEAPIGEQTDLLSALRDAKAIVKKQDLGPEQVGSYRCEKFHVKVTSRGRTQAGWIWVAKAKHLGGFIVKAQEAESKESISLSNIQLAAPEPSLFDLPAGYHKLTGAPKSPKGGR